MEVDSAWDQERNGRTKLPTHKLPTHPTQSMTMGRLKVMDPLCQVDGAPAVAGDPLGGPNQ